MTESKKVPQAVDVEFKILGGILLNNEKIEDVLSYIKPEYFYDRRNRVLFESMVSLSEQRKPIDNVTLYEQLKKTNNLESAGGAAYVGKLSQDITSAANIEYHCIVVREYWQRRKLISVSLETVEKVYAAEHDPLDIASETANELDNLEKDLIASDPPPSVAVHGALQYIEDAINGKLSKYFIPTGIQNIDFHLLGFPRKEVAIVAGRPAMGKTAIMLQFAKNVTKFGEIPGIFSLEMSKEQLMIRQLANESLIDSHKILAGTLTDSEMVKISRASSGISKSLYRLDDRSGLTPNQIIRQARRWKRKFGVSIILIDFLQRINPDVRLENQNLTVGYIMKQFANFAKQEDMSVVIFSQLNRSVETRGDKRPTLSDLRDSGEIEQDASTVLFLYRPDYYNIKESIMPNFTQRYTLAGEPLLDSEYLEIINAKNRFGITGTYIVRYLAQYQKIEETRPDGNPGTHYVPYPDNDTEEDIPI